MKAQLPGNARLKYYSRWIKAIKPSYFPNAIDNRSDFNKCIEV